MQKTLTPLQQVAAEVENSRHDLLALPHVGIPYQGRFIPAIALRADKYNSPPIVEVLYPFPFFEKPSLDKGVRAGKFRLPFRQQPKTPFDFKREWLQAEEIYLLEREVPEIIDALQAVLEFETKGLYTKNEVFRKQIRRQAWEAMEKWETLVEDGLPKTEPLNLTGNYLPL